MKRTETERSVARLTPQRRRALKTMSNAKRNPWLPVAINMLVLGGAIYFLSGIFKNPQTKEVSYRQFLAQVRSDQFHESGHTLVALSVKHADSVQRVSIIPRTIGAVGYTLQLLLHERYLMTQCELEDQIAVMLGGRAAEELVFNGLISSGAAHDLERASELVRRIVTRFGMSKELGPMTWGVPTQPRFLSLPQMEQRNYSENTAQTIDEEERRIIAEIYTRVKEILTNRRDDLEIVATELIRKETLTREELDRLLASRFADLVPR